MPVQSVAKPSSAVCRCGSSGSAAGIRNHVAVSRLACAVGGGWSGTDPTGDPRSGSGLVREPVRQRDVGPAREVVHVAVGVGGERARQLEYRLALLRRVDVARRERAAFAYRPHCVRHGLPGEHRSQEVRVQRVEPPALGRIARGGDDRLRDDEAAEQHVAEPIRCFAEPGSFAGAGSHGEELERLGDQCLDVGLGAGFGHRHEPRDPSAVGPREFGLCGRRLPCRA